MARIVVFKSVVLMLFFNHFQSINILLPIAHKSARIGKISILKLEGITKKFPMSVATMSRLTKKAYHRLCHEKLRKKFQALKG